MTQPEQEPVALQYPQKDIDWQQEQQIKAQASIPPQRTLVGLTYEEQEEIVLSAHSIRDAINKTDWKLKEKNT